MNDNIAIAHKDYDVRGGGEKLAERLAEGFDAPLYTGRFKISKFPAEKQIDVRPLFTKQWQKMLIDRGGLVRSLAYRYLWQQDATELDQFDTLILSGNEPLWYIGPDTQTTIAYTHSTPRWFYDLFNEISNDIGGRIWKILLEKQRQEYYHHVCRPDYYVANSELVARRIQKYYGIPQDRIEVVYPPATVGTYSADTAETRDYYLVVSRLADAKGLDWLIQQANRLNLSLKIAGRGPEAQTLRARAGETVEMLGYVSEQRKRELLAGAKAFIMPAMNEDFGMTPVEAFASGTPVLGVNEGFTQFQVQPGKNGYLFKRTSRDFERRIEQFESDGVEWSDRMIEQFAENFSVEQFQAKMHDIVAEAQELSKVEAEYQIDPEAQADIPVSDD